MIDCAAILTDTEDMDKLNLLNLSEKALHECESAAYQKCFKDVLRHFHANDIHTIEPEKVREFLDGYIKYHKEFVFALVEKYNEKLKECEGWKARANKEITKTR